MNALRRTLLLSAALGVVMVGAAAAAAFDASPVRAGESSVSTILVCSSSQPTFTATPPDGITVSFSAPTNSQTASCTSLWTASMTISAAASATPGAYQFPLSATSPSGATLYTDTVTVEVSPAISPTTSSSSTSTTTAATTSTSTTAATTTTSTPSTTTSTTTQPTTTTTTQPTTTTTTTTPTTSTTTSTTSPPATAAPTTTVVAAGDPQGLPGAAISDDTGISGGVIALGVAALVVLGWIAITSARDRHIKPASKGKFGRR